MLGHGGGFILQIKRPMPKRSKTTKSSNSGQMLQANPGMQSKKQPPFALTSGGGITKFSNAPKPKPRPQRNPSGTKYTYGMHGAKTSEQKRLKELYDEPVSGKTHQSEHPIGFEPINRDNLEKRGTKGRTKDLENFAPAYQEVLKLHRDHIGTGKGSPYTREEYEKILQEIARHNKKKGVKKKRIPTRPKVDEAGFTALEYRNAQHDLMDENEPGLAIQLNQLGYAFMPEFGWNSDIKHQQSNDSFFQMVEGVDKFDIAADYEDDNQERVVENRTIHFKSTDKKEMLASRAVAKLGRNLVPTELSLLHLVTIGDLDYNLFLTSCYNGDLNEILIQQGLEHDEKTIMNKYWEERNQFN